MSSQRTLLVLVLGLAAACAAPAQTSGSLRWRGGAAPLGLQLAADDWRAPCGSIAFPCEGSTVRLYASQAAPRSLSLQVGTIGSNNALQAARAEDLSWSVVGRTGVAPNLGLYGRVGTTGTRAAPALAGMPGSESGLTYGVGLSWDFSKRGSASVGWDSYDFRTLGGETRDVRATSLGLQWRY
jgi:OOP family OmpA-OmpF porin